MLPLFQAKVSLQGQVAGLEAQVAQLQQELGARVNEISKLRERFSLEVNKVPLGVAASTMLSFPTAIHAVLPFHYHKASLAVGFHCSAVTCFVI